MIQQSSVPDGWREVKLGDVCEIIGGGTPSTKIAEYWNGDIPWITPKDLSNYAERYISNGERSISSEGLRNSSARIIPKGSVLLTTRAPVGYLAIAGTEVSTNQGFRSLLPKLTEANNIFLFYLLKDNVNYLKANSEGSTFGELAGSTLKSLYFSLPPLPEQKAIAEVLSSLDDKIDLLHRQNTTLENMAQTLFRKWFAEDADDDWEERRIGEVTEFMKGRKPKQAEKIMFTNSLPQILIETFDTGKQLYSDRDRMIIANEYDILMVMDGASSGRTEIGFRGIVGSTIGLYKPLENFNYPFFVFSFLKTHEQYIKENTTGSAIPHVDKALVSSLRLKFPSMKKVGDFDSMAEEYFTKKRANMKQIRTLENLRNLLLPKLMSGKVRMEQQE